MDKEINDLLLVTKNIINVLKPTHSTSDLKNIIDKMIENNFPTSPIWMEVKELKADENYTIKLFELLNKINDESKKEYDNLEDWALFSKTCNMLIFLVQNLLDILIRKYSLKIYEIKQRNINRK